MSEATLSQAPTHQETGRERLVAASGREAVTQVEAAICGDGASTRASVAEGMALAGRRAAGLPGFGVGDADPGSGAGRAPWVLHKVMTRPGAGWGDFELWPSTVQEAADDCLVAQLLAARLGGPGVCALSPSLAERVELFRAALASVLDAPLETPNGDAVGLASAAFAQIGSATGRPSAPVEVHELAEAEVVLVGVGAVMAAARRAVDALRAHGVSVGALTLRLVRPFPAGMIAPHLAGRTVVLLEEGAAATSLLRAALEPLGKETLHTIRVEPNTPWPTLARLLAEQLPGSSLAPESLELPSDTPWTVGVAPAGPWGEAFLRELAALRGRLGPLEVRPWKGPSRGVLAWSCSSDGSAGGEQLDALVVPATSWLDPDGPLSLLRDGGAIILRADVASSEAVWRSLHPRQRAAIARRGLEVRWVGGGSPGETWRLQGALLGTESQPIPSLCQALEAEGLQDAARALREGAESVQVIDDPAALERRGGEEIDFRAQSTLPRLPAAVADEATRARWREQVQHFHLTGQQPEPGPGQPLQPALLKPLLAEERSRTPVLFLDDCGPAAALDQLLRDQVAGLGASRVLQDNLPRLEARIRQALTGKRGLVTCADVVRSAGEGLAADLALPADEDRVLRDDLARLIAKLPSGSLLGSSDHAPLHLYSVVTRATAGPPRVRFRQELKSVAARLDELLVLDAMRSAQARSPEAVSRSLGGGPQLVDVEAFAARLPQRSGSEPLSPERRARIEQAHREIGAFLQAPDQLPTLIHGPLVTAEALRGVPGTPLEHPDPLGLAVGVFDGQVGATERLLRAVRVASLEVADRYRPELHDEPLADLSWESFAPDELALLPQVLVVLQERELAASLTSFSTLLRSGRPLRVLVLLDGATARFDTHVPSFGYQAVAHREAVVVQSSMARAVELAAGFARMAGAPRPAIAFVEQPRWVGAAWPDLWALAALESRAVPTFRYDPDAGESWADRFEMTGNPQLEQAWPRHTLACAGEEGPASFELEFTFAHLAALVPSCRRHLWVIPPEAWGEPQVPIGEFLRGFDPGRSGPPDEIPFVWLEQEGRLSRAIVTRELAFACRDRLRLWATLQELAGVNSEHMRRAASAARAEAKVEAEASRAELEAAHKAELDQVRAQAAEQTVDHLVGVLLGSEPVGPSSLRPPTRTPAPAAAAPGAPLPVAEPPPAATPAAEPEPEEELSFDEPYIDTPLCTTCNECINLNSMLFKYNAEKQAYIADPEDGTFQDLVFAAEACPAKIIHPGKPRAGDSTATQELLERAAPFN